MAQQTFLGEIAAACRSAQTEDELRSATSEVIAAHADEDERALAEALVEATAGRLSAEERLSDLATRVNHAQELANMGDYDWHIATDTNTWSNQLYRIYGYEPQSFNASYEKFLSMLFEEDRERIQGVHQAAYASGEPYQMIERIVRPDGELRYLSSNGQVMRDANGNPERMRGTCIDITDLVHAQEEATRSDRRFRRLVESFPDAILVIDQDRVVVQANERAEQLFDGDPVGASVPELMAGEDIEGLDVPGQTMKGDLLRLDVALARMADDSDSGDHDLIAVFIRDAHPRLAQESIVATLREAQVRRRQALELNDNVVQGLTAAIMSQDSLLYDEATMHLDRTMASARRLMNEWIEPLNGADLQPGDLLRTSASVLDGADMLSMRNSLPRILIVDDNDDVRRLLRIQLETGGQYAVVGEGTDGREGVKLATELQPDVVLLDLAMPVMDGLEALPLIKAAVDNVKVIVLSGFDEGSMRDIAFQAGASKYVEKGVRMGLPGHIDEVLDRASSSRRPAS